MPLSRINKLFSKNFSVVERQCHFGPGFAILFITSLLFQSKHVVAQQKKSTDPISKSSESAQMINSSFSFPITGIVTDDRKMPVKSARITISEFLSNIDVAETKSDDSGRYKLNVLNPGHYKIRASHPGYDSLAVAVISIIANSETVKNFEFHYIAAKYGIWETEQPVLPLIQYDNVEVIYIKGDTTLIAKPMLKHWWQKNNKVIHKK